MTILHAIILSVVEGITEFLPISSTGHLILTTKLLGISESSFTKSFDIIIQLGAILAVFFVYAKRLWQSKQLWLPLTVAFAPTAIVGISVYKVLKIYLLGNQILVAIALIIGGILMIIFEKWYKYQTKTPLQTDSLTTKKSFYIGLFQTLAIIPGVSRSAATIIGGMLQGLSRSAALEFSFLLALPTMAAATGLDLVKNGTQFSTSEWQILFVGFIGSFISAFFAVKWLLKYIQTHDFVIFGYYRILVGVIFLFFR